MNGTASKVILSFILLNVFISTTAFSATYYSNSNLWRASYGFADITTESFTGDIASAPLIVFSTGIGSQGNAGMGTVVNRVNEVMDGEWTGRVRNLSMGTNGFQSITWTFPAGTLVDGFGVNASSISSSAGVRISGNFDGNGVVSIDLWDHFSNSGSGFFGVKGNSTFGSITFTAEGSNDNDLFNLDQASFHQLFLPSSNLSIVKSNATHFSQPGAPVSWTITVVNIGPDFAEGALVIDNVPSRVQNPSWTCMPVGASSSCASGGAVMMGNVLESVNVAVGESINVVLTGILNQDESGQLINTATVSLPVTAIDVDEANNTSTDIDAIGLFIDSFESLQ